MSVLLPQLVPSKSAHALTEASLNCGPQIFTGWGPNFQDLTFGM